jgi:hypothetical protein
VLARPQGVGYPVTFTLQGFIMDDGSASHKPASVTNAVIVEIR